MDRKSENRLVFHTDGSAFESDKAGLVRAVLQHIKKAAPVFVRNVEIDADETYRLSADGSELQAVGNKWNDSTHVREEPYTCTPRPELQGWPSRPASLDTRTVAAPKAVRSVARAIRSLPGAGRIGRHDY